MSTTLSLPQRQQQVLSYILACYRDGYLPSPVEAAEHFGLPRTTTQRAFRGLVSKGYLQRRGKRAHWHWGLTKQFLNQEME